MGINYITRIAKQVSRDVKAEFEARANNLANNLK